MKIVKRGENSVANGTSIGVNELSDDDLDDVVGGYTRGGHWYTSYDFKFSKDEFEKLCSLYPQFKNYNPDTTFSTTTMASLLGCKDRHGDVEAKLKNIGLKMN